MCVTCVFVYHYIKKKKKLTRRRRHDIASTSFCLSQRRRKYISNETPNEVSVELCQNFSVVRLYNVMKKRLDKVSRICNSNIPLIRLHNVSNQSHMKHPTACRWYVSTMLHKNIVVRYLKISDHQFLNCIEKRLGEAKKTVNINLNSENQNTRKQNQKKINHGCYEQIAVKKILSLMLLYNRIKE